MTSATVGRFISGETIASDQRLINACMRARYISSSRQSGAEPKGARREAKRVSTNAN
jgi:hypothetical protein